MDSDNPEWWTENEKLREYLGLPPYDPPQFEDGVYIHHVIPEVEETYTCKIQFIGINTEYLDDWEVRIDGKTAFEISRYRNENGNTIYEMESTQFRDCVDTWFENNPLTS